MRSRSHRQQSARLREARNERRERRRRGQDENSDAEGGYETASRDDAVTHPQTGTTATPASAGEDHQRDLAPSHNQLVQMTTLTPTNNAATTTNWVGGMQTFGTLQPALPSSSTGSVPEFDYAALGDDPYAKLVAARMKSRELNTGIHPNPNSASSYNSSWGEPLTLPREQLHRREAELREDLYISRRSQ